MLGLVEDGERVGAEQLVVGLRRVHPGDAPAHEPAEPARVGEPDRRRRAPTASSGGPPRPRGGGGSARSHSGSQSSSASSPPYGARAMRLIQHKREAYWFYRFLSLGYDRWVNPLFWTPAMRALALEEARLEPGLTVLDAGAGTGFTTEGIVARVEAARRDDARPEPAPARALAVEAGAGGLPAGAGRRRGAARSPTTAFDRYVSAGSIEYWPDPQRGIAEAYRVTRAGGTALVIGPVRPANRVARALAETWMLFPPVEEYTRLDGGRGLHRRARARARAGLVPRPARAVRARGQRRQARAGPVAGRAARAAVEEPVGRCAFAARFVARLGRGRRVRADRRRARAPRPLAARRAA